ncbi:hypothetical protein LPJ57_009816, partial [Coemansia sp. RSA 486]
ETYLMVNKPSAYELWQTLETLFDRKRVGSLLSSLKELLSFKQDDFADPIEYWVKAQNMWASFPYKEINFAVLSVVVPLWGLSDKYSSVRDKF